MTDQNRRFDDHLTKTPDHDLLIKLHTKMDSVCKAITRSNEELRSHTEGINAQLFHRTEVCTAKFDKKLDSGTFWRLVAILVIIFGTIFTGIGLNKMLLTEHSQDIKNNVVHIGELMKD